ncbi:MAG: efflux RND transporter permease subunit [Magnetococcales bacterium]|nr:efflux RND transporter permease subunit [Magnetococcales bacterium]
MSPVRFSIERPVAVAVGVLLLLMFGLLAFARIPVQLTPDVRKPVITVETRWPGAAPMEVENELTIPQEEVLKSLPGLEKINSSSSLGRVRIKLEFQLGTDMDSAMVLVSNRLQKIRDYPDDSFRPTLKSADSDSSPITWMRIQHLDPEDSRPVYNQLDFVEDSVQPAMESIPGVAGTNIYGGRKRELRVTVDSARLAARGITISDLAQALRRENADISAGQLDEGKRRYLIRSTGRFRNPDDVKTVVVRSDPSGPITVADIASVDFGFQDATVTVRGNGRPALVLNAVREQGANVLEIMNQVHETVNTLNETVLKPRGLYLTVLYDQTDYIHAALDLVRNNLLIGALLAMGVLLLFLRSFSPTVIIALAIPISVIGAFLAMYGLGRTVNVISLAGLAFSVGMVVDPAIVVLENIVRLRQNGQTVKQAALHGTQQVWGAILISTITTVAVFLPILTLQIEAAQLFGDIAVALSAAVMLSLIVSTTVIPTMSVRLMGRGSKSTASVVQDNLKDGLFVRLLVGLTKGINRSLLRRLMVVISLVVGGIWLTLNLIPPAEYLPSGNRNLIFAMLIPPPGYNLEEMARMAGGVEKELMPHWQKDPEHPDQPPLIRHFFFAARGAIAFMGGAASEPERVGELLPIIRHPIANLPGTIGIVNQRSLFSRGLGAGRSLDLTITGADLETTTDLARQLFGTVKGILPGAQVRPIPGLELGNPEVHLIPNRQRARENGLSALEIGQAVQALTDGLKVDELIINGRQMDLVIQGETGPLQHIQDIGTLPLSTRNNAIIPVSTVAQLTPTAGPVEIQHVDRRRAVILRINPPKDMAMESAVDKIQNELISPTIAQGLPPMTTLALSEGADQLLLAKQAMGNQFLLALSITFLLMAALFESFLYPLVIIATVPLAAAGGVIGLTVLNIFHFQPMDVLTMLGFVVLIGVVVNNAILIVHQALHFMRDEKMTVNDAVVASVRIRIRPIFMSTFTSVCGLLPLVLFPGAGSELYRGMGSVIIGGLLLSTILTLVLAPTLFSLLVRQKNS